MEIKEQKKETFEEGFNKHMDKVTPEEKKRFLEE